eukprot:1679937-Heterocapsa_arctica.AAC.1
MEPASRRNMPMIAQRPGGYSRSPRAGSEEVAPGQAAVRDLRARFAVYAAESERTPGICMPSSFSLRSRVREGTWRLHAELVPDCCSEAVQKAWSPQAEQRGVQFLGLLSRDLGGQHLEAEVGLSP